MKAATARASADCCGRVDDAEIKEVRVKQLGDAVFQPFDGNYACTDGRCVIQNLPRDTVEVRVWVESRSLNRFGKEGAWKTFGQADLRRSFGDLVVSEVRDEPNGTKRIEFQSSAVHQNFCAPVCCPTPCCPPVYCDQRCYSPIIEIPTPRCVQNLEPSRPAYDAVGLSREFRSTMHEVRLPFKRLAGQLRIAKNSGTRDTSQIGVESLPIGRMRL